MNPVEIVLRRAMLPDLEAVAALQAAAPEGAQWPASDYLDHECWIAERNGELAGFLVYRCLGEGESELLNLAVDPAHRRQGIARRLLALLPPGRTFLEVRASNAAAIALYQAAGFTEAGCRKAYYTKPLEDGIVMARQK